MCVPGEKVFVGFCVLFFVDSQSKIAYSQNLARGSAASQAQNEKNMSEMKLKKSKNTVPTAAPAPAAAGSTAQRRCPLWRLKVANKYPTHGDGEGGATL